MARGPFNHPYREIQDIPEDRELLSPISAYSPRSPTASSKLRRPSIETVYHVPEKLIVPQITERWEQPSMKLVSTPTQRYEGIAHQGLSDAYARMRRSYRLAMLAALAGCALQTVLSGASVAVTDSGVLHTSLIAMAVLVS